MKRYVRSALLALGMLLVLGGAVSAQAFGTKVQAGDPDLGLPLSAFSPVGGNIPTAVSTQAICWLSYWDIGSTPGIYDDKDVLYLQFGSSPGTLFPNRIVRENNIRLTGWGNYAAGSKVKPGDADMGQQLVPNAGVPPLAAPGVAGFLYMNVAGSAGYDMGDPVYVKAATPGLATGTNDVRITPTAGFPAGSRVSLGDPDAAKPLVPFKTGLAFFGPAGGPTAATLAIGFPVAQLAFFNANGNVAGVLPIYDDQDIVYLDVAPLNVVSPNDVRLYE